RGMLFYRLLDQAVVTMPVTYQHVVAQSKSQKSGSEELSG
ncbi:MAG: IS1595 family transposase, partial [Pseudohongiella sp.]|nr:IS1595 family transposase [Pseudohongiella sp.]